MGLTPIESRSDEESEPRGGQDSPGVRQRVWRTVARLVADALDGLGALLFPATGQSDYTVRGKRDRRPQQKRKSRERREATAIRRSGQARLESGAGQSRESIADDEPAHRRDLRIEAQVRGDTLRVYDPDSDDAYITSDSYERVER